MRRRLISLLALPMVFQATASPAGAIPTGTNATTQTDQTKDELVCQRILVTGSRVGGKRICQTRQQWAEQKLQDRQAIERAQASPCVLTHTGGNGKPAC